MSVDSNAEQDILNAEKDKQCPAVILLDNSLSSVNFNSTLFPKEVMAYGIEKEKRCGVF